MRQKLMKMDQIGLCQTWHVSCYEGSLRSVLSHSALQQNELKKNEKRKKEKHSSAHWKTTAARS